jgi:hypothetical protein
MSIFKYDKNRRRHEMKFNKIHFRFRSQSLNIFNYDKKENKEKTKINFENDASYDF